MPFSRHGKLVSRIGPLMVVAPTQRNVLTCFLLASLSGKRASHNQICHIQEDYLMFLLDHSTDF